MLSFRSTELPNHIQLVNLLDIVSSKGTGKLVSEFLEVQVHQRADRTKEVAHFHQHMLPKPCLVTLQRISLETSFEQSPAGENVAPDIFLYIFKICDPRFTPRNEGCA